MENNNLLVAQKIVSLMSDKNRPHFAKKDFVLDPDDLPELRNKEIEQVLITLSKKLLNFLNREDIDYSTGGYKYFKIEPNKRALKIFIKTANNNKSTLKVICSNEISSVLKIFEIIQKKRTKTNGNPIDHINIKEFSNISDAIKILYQISLYSDAIDIIEEYEADFDEVDGIIKPTGAFPYPDHIDITSKQVLNKLFDEIKKVIEKQNVKKISLMLKKHKALDWRCKNCGRFLGRIDDKKTINGFLNEFSLGKYKACHKCREKNYFNIDDKGEITFLRHTDVDKR